MNLGELRIEIRERSGDASHSDAFMNERIAEGQRLLDRRMVHPKAKRPVTVNILAGAHEVEIPDCRAILNIWVESADGELIELEKLTYAEMVEEFPEWDASDADTPIYYAIAPSATSDRHRNVILMPPTDVAYILTVLGLHYSDEMALDLDDSYWGTLFPEVLLDAAMYRYYTYLGYTTEAQRQLQIVDAFLIELDNDIAEEESASVIEVEA